MSRRAVDMDGVKTGRAGTFGHMTGGRATDADSAATLRIGDVLTLAKRGTAVGARFGFPW